MLNDKVTEFTDVNAIFQAVTLECCGELDTQIVNDVIESILNDTYSITTLFYHTIMQQAQILYIYSKFTKLDVNELIEKVTSEYSEEYSGYMMQTFYFKNVLSSAVAIIEDKQRLQYEYNSDKFNSSAEIFFSTFSEFTEAFKYIPTFNHYFAKKILPGEVTVSKFLKQVFLTQQLYLNSGSID